MLSSTRLIGNGKKFIPNWQFQKQIPTNGIFIPVVNRIIIQVPNDLKVRKEVLKNSDCKIELKIKYFLK